MAASTGGIIAAIFGEESEILEDVGGGGGAFVGDVDFVVFYKLAGLSIDHPFFDEFNAFLQIDSAETSYPEWRFDVNLLVINASDVQNFVARNSRHFGTIAVFIANYSPI
jgi:hypothetical protein